MPRRKQPESTVYPIHFEDYSGSDFERLCFAYIYNAYDTRTIDWYGQLGGDSGRDIWATVVEPSQDVKNYCFQCANHQKLRFNKAKTDIDKIVVGSQGRPDVFILITGGKVTAKLKERIRDYSSNQGISRCEIWSSIELEERLRKLTPQLLSRFCEGKPFPEDAKALIVLGSTTVFENDHDILEAFAQCFDRPAFQTSFQSESSIPAFKQAITDTIEALNTGVYRLRDGTEIRRIPTRHSIRDAAIKRTLAQIVDDLVTLRTEFDSLCKSGQIRPCRCDRDDCPIFEATHEAADEMNYRRYVILEKFASVFPDFDRFHYFHLAVQTAPNTK